MSQFVDHVVLHVSGGDGGHGCSSVHREKFKPLGGPDGANGGNGGDVILEVSGQVSTLLDYHHSPHRRASNGVPGQGGMRHGADGDDLVLPVPAGTVVWEWVDGGYGRQLADLSTPGMRCVIAPGGRGGLGNAALASTRRKAPGFALKGEPGHEVSIALELKSMADVALVGYPSAGKSSLIAVMSAARPKIADYPFTTLVPNLGVVEAGQTRFTMADVPGLIEGASSGKGLGLDFLRHVERCSVIVHVLDCATLESDRDPITDLDTLVGELAAYPVTTYDSEEVRPLTERPAVVVLSKIDDPDAREMAKMVRPALEERGYACFETSALTREGLKEFSFALAQRVTAHRENRSAPVAERAVLRPVALDDAGFTITAEPSADAKDGVLYRVTGDKPERWVVQTDFANEEAIGYLADRLARLGVEDELMTSGAVAGSTVAIGRGSRAVLFDWEPTMSSGAEVLAGPRGTDPRFAPDASRPTRGEKRREFTERMDAKREAREQLDAERSAGLWADDET